MSKLLLLHLLALVPTARNSSLSTSTVPAAHPLALVAAAPAVPVNSHRPAPASRPTQAPARWKVGDKVESGPGAYHPATVLEAPPSGSYRLHYDDNAYPDGWVEVYFIRARNTDQAMKSLAAAGPRLGKYLLYAYGAVGTAGMYLGYFELRTGGEYHVFAPGGRDIGSGRYAFDKARLRVNWQSGPFASPDWDGTQGFEVSREGKTHIIRLKRNTIGTNSTDAAK